MKALSDGTFKTVCSLCAALTLIAVACVPLGISSRVFGSLRLE